MDPFGAILTNAITADKMGRMCTFIEKNEKCFNAPFQRLFAYAKIAVSSSSSYFNGSMKEDPMHAHKTRKAVMTKKHAKNSMRAIVLSSCTKRKRMS